MIKSANDEVGSEILATIRRQLAASVPHDTVRNEHAQHQATHLQSTITTAEGDGTSIPAVELFAEALTAVAGHCAIVHDEALAAEVLKQIIEGKKASRIAVSDSALVQRVVEKLDRNFELLANPSAAELFDCDIGITSAQWAVAETGTLVLESERERHRLVSLVPAVHVAIIFAQSVRHTLGEVLAGINESGRQGLSRTVTFITGPSRTSDIELTLAIGVHGPAELYVIIVEGSDNG